MVVDRDLGEITERLGLLRPTCDRKLWKALITYVLGDMAHKEEKKGNFWTTPLWAIKCLLRTITSTCKWAWTSVELGKNIIGQSIQQINSTPSDIWIIPCLLLACTRNKDESNTSIGEMLIILPVRYILKIHQLTNPPQLENEEK